MTKAQRDAFANELEREWHLTCVPGVDAPKERHLVLVHAKPAQVFW